MVDVIEVTELLEQGQGIRAAPQPVAVVADWTLTGGRFDHVARRDQELSLFLAAHRILGTPAGTVTGSLVPAPDDVPREVGMVLGRLADHVASDTDPMTGPAIEDAAK